MKFWRLPTLPGYPPSRTARLLWLGFGVLTVGASITFSVSTPLDFNAWAGPVVVPLLNWFGSAGLMGAVALLVFGANHSHGWNVALVDVGRRPVAAGSTWLVRTAALPASVSAELTRR